jgi:hypothetical protein
LLWLRGGLSCRHHQQQSQKSGEELFYAWASWHLTQSPISMLLCTCDSPCLSASSMFLRLHSGFTGGLCANAQRQIHGARVKTGDRIGRCLKKSEEDIGARGLQYSSCLGRKTSEPYISIALHRFFKTTKQQKDNLLIHPSKTRTVEHEARAIDIDAVLNLGEERGSFAARQFLRKVPYNYNSLAKHHALSCCEI